VGWRQGGWVVVLAVLAVACGEVLPVPALRKVDAGPPVDVDLPVDAGPPPDAGPVPAPAVRSPGSVFDLDRLHVVTIEVDVAFLATLNDDRNQARVPALVSYDGVAMPSSGVRKKGFHGSRRDLFDKTGFTVDVHEFVREQRLFGLKKLTLNNAVQDPSFLHEHLAYEMFRRVGLPAPQTAHALVTFNGEPFGLYVVKESVDGEFLDRNFGGQNDQGNLYEGPCCHDFVINPENIELKDEWSEMRSRQDLLELARLIADTPDSEWEVVLGARLDLDNLIDSYALDAVTDHFDDYFFNGNNYYLYHHPRTGKFLMIPHGMDEALGSLRDPLRLPLGQLGLRIRGQSALDRRFRQAIQRVLAHAFDLPALGARIDRAAAAILAHTPTDARTVADFTSLRENLLPLKQYLARRKVWAPAPGDPVDLP
jgi:hypothetical protein